MVGSDGVAGGARRLTLVAGTTPSLREAREGPKFLASLLKPKLCFFIFSVPPRGGVPDASWVGND
ncbi:hypothetical protein ACVIWV_000821 [Bradyrhizobium diazoefficiens]|nr:hypothetical protein [Bradyrhizobium japonicum]